jgi:hypothetical protein
VPPMKASRPKIPLGDRLHAMVFLSSFLSFFVLIGGLLIAHWMTTTRDLAAGKVTEMQAHLGGGLVVVAVVGVVLFSAHIMLKFLCLTGDRNDHPVSIDPKPDPRPRKKSPREVKPHLRIVSSDRRAA